MLEDWNERLESLIQEVIGDGDVSHLPGAGRPLKLEPELERSPLDRRAADKIRRDHNILPEWITLSSEIDQERSRLESQIQRAVRAYRGALADARRKADITAEVRAHQTWTAIHEQIAAAVQTHNRKVLIYNLKAPSAVASKIPFDLEKMLQGLLD